MASYSDMGSERERIMALKKAYNNVDASSFTAEDNHALDTCLRTLKLAIWGATFGPPAVGFTLAQRSGKPMLATMSGVLLFLGGATLGQFYAGRLAFGKCMERYAELETTFGSEIRKALPQDDWQRLVPEKFRKPPESLAGGGVPLEESSGESASQREVTGERESASEAGERILDDGFFDLFALQQSDSGLDFEAEGEKAEGTERAVSRRGDRARRKEQIERRRAHREAAFGL